MSRSEYLDDLEALNMITPAQKASLMAAGTLDARLAVKRPATEAERRKGQPVARGVLAYFPKALLKIAEVSKAGNDQHNPGQPLHWAKGKSTDHADCLVRHLLDHLSGVPVDTDGQPHLAKVAWRALALLETELEKESVK